MGYIYKITNTSTNKCYIGCSKEKNVEYRWNEHIRLINKDKGCPALRDAVKKHGWEKFKFEVLIICFDEDCFELEKHYIKKYNSQTPNGYNITPGGEGGGFKGKKHTEESKQKISEYFKKYYSDPENRRKNGLLVKESLKNINIRQLQQKSEKWQQYLIRIKTDKKGKPLSDNTRQKISQSLYKYYSKDKDDDKKNNQIIFSDTQKILQLKLDDTPLAVYKNIKVASRMNNISINSIKNTIKEYTKTGGGYKWKLA